MKERCVHCLTIRDRSKLFEDQPGVWYCRNTFECLEFFANLPDWLRV